MKTKTILFSVTSILLSGFVFASETSEDWVQVASTVDFEWHGKKGSGSISNLGNKKNNAYSYVIQKLNKKEKTLHYTTVFVELTSCKKGYGYFYYNNMEGKYTGRDAFVRFGPTVADNLGSMACYSWDQQTGKASLVNKENTWKVVAESAKTGNKLSIKTDSIRKIDYNNKPAVSVLYGFYSVAKETTNYGEYVIQTSDCKRGYGVAYERDFDGKLFEKTDVVLDGDSVLSITITALCKTI